MAFGLFPAGAIDVVIALHTKLSPADDEWDRYVDIARDAARRGVMARYRGFTVTLGGGPNSKQRKMLIDAFGGAPSGESSVFTDSAAIRGIITAFRWVRLSNMRAFSLDESDAGLTFMGVEAQHREALLAYATQLGCALTPNPMTLLRG